MVRFSRPEIGWLPQLSRSKRRLENERARRSGLKPVGGFWPGQRIVEQSHFRASRKYIGCVGVFGVHGSTSNPLLYAHTVMEA